jgi:hypothetical protein
MTDSRSRSSHRRAGRHPRRRAGALATAAAGLALAAAGCSSSPAASSGGSSNYQKDVAFAQCMRSHGEPSFPDPSSGGGFQLPASVQASSSQFESANNSCKSLLPNGGQISPAESQKLLTNLLNFAQCMRTHGISNFPDPVQIGSAAQITLPQGFATDSPQFVAAQQACASLRTGGTS